MIEEIIEHINPGADIVIKWNELWYKIPFIVIADELAEVMGKHPNLLYQHRFSSWCNKFPYKEWTQSDIDLFKQIYEPMMPRMEAYLWYKANQQ